MTKASRVARAWGQCFPGSRVAGTLLEAGGSRGAVAHGRLCWCWSGCPEGGKDEAGRVAGAEHQGELTVCSSLGKPWSVV